MLRGGSTYHFFLKALDKMGQGSAFTLATSPHVYVEKRRQMYCIARMLVGNGGVQLSILA